MRVVLKVDFESEKIQSKRHIWYNSLTYIRFTIQSWKTQYEWVRGACDWYIALSGPH